MNIIKSKLQRIFTAYIALMLTLAFISCLPATVAQDAPTMPIQTKAYLYFEPNPIGVNQYLTVQGWVCPRPLFNTQYYYNYKFIFTKPNGSTETITIERTEKPATTWFFYKPDQIGDWTVQLVWDAYDTPTGPSGNHTAASTPKQPLVVQQEPIPSWPYSPSLPTDGWTWPINPENREWSTIAGPWLQSGYNASGTNFNPYTQAPKSSHILWKLPPISGTAGTQGGSYAFPYYSSTRVSLSAVIDGKGYYTGGGYIHCIDIRTGKELWTALGSFSVARIENNLPTLWNVGSRLIKYNALTGAVTLNITGMMSASLVVGNYAYSRQIIKPGESYFIKWNVAGTSANFASRMVYNATWAFIDPTNRYEMFRAADDPNLAYTIGCPRNTENWGTAGGINLTNGAKLWERTVPHVMTMGSIGEAYNMLVACKDYDERIFAVSILNGNQLWESEQTDYPWGQFWAYTHGAGYNYIYKANYAGLYAFNRTTGEIEWHYSTGDSLPYGETPYGTWPIWHGPVIGGGAVYVSTGEWGEGGTIYYRGQQLHAMDAFTGEGLWSIMGFWTMGPIAEGTLFANNAYDGYSYAFSRGSTLTEVTTDQSRIDEGRSVWITGRVTDQSPAQPGTPAVSKDSMSDWMEYLHMQQSRPTDTKGVPVKLIAVYSNGSIIDLGSTTTNGNGDFSFEWTPPKKDLYTITASFAGDDSYYSSWNLTSLNVGSTVAAQPDYPQPIAPIDYTPMFTAIIAAVAIVAVLVVIDIALARRHK